LAAAGKKAHRRETLLRIMARLQRTAFLWIAALLQRACVSSAKG